MISTQGITSDLGRDQFLQLLVAQLRSQNPLDPIKDEGFIAQLAQFSTLEGIEKLNTNFSDMLTLQQLTQSTNLLGQAVVYVSPTSGQPQRGTVQGVITENNQLLLILTDGNRVPLNQVRGIAKP